MSYPIKDMFSFLRSTGLVCVQRKKRDWKKICNVMNAFAVFSEKISVQSFSGIYEIIYLMKIIRITNQIKDYFLSLLLAIEILSL